ncbi:ketoacyl-ACP synthase III [Litorivivens sp.]|uniref:ketoacyl-ACP synthase III n=3 Tax=Litorivivens sp. TaxID=2020868 RepID=UPI003567F993
MRYANITGWGKCLPPAVLTNEDLTTVMETSDEWISSRTGIKERRITHVKYSELAALAGKRALAAAGLEASDIDMIILATAAPDNMIPNGASAVQDMLGAKNAAVFDLNAACTGFVYGLSIATAMVRAGSVERVMVIGVDGIPYYLDWTMREVSVLFGDAAGAVIVEPSEEECGLLADKLGCDGDARDILMACDSGSVRERFGPIDGHFAINFEGQEIFKRAVRGMGFAMNNVLDRLNLKPEDIDLVIPHQANIRIIETLAKRLNAPMDKVMVNIEKYGNTSAATVPVALCEALEQGRIKPGDHVLAAAFGAGLTWGAFVVKWGDRVEPLGTCDDELPPCDKTALEILQPWIEGGRRANGQ